MGKAADTLPTAKTPDVSSGRKREPGGGGEVGDSKGLENADRAVLRRMMGNERGAEALEREPASRTRDDDDGQAEDRHDDGEDGGDSDRYISSSRDTDEQDEGGEDRREAGSSPTREADRRQRAEVEAAARTILKRDSYTDKEITVLLKNTDTADLHDLIRRIRKRHADSDNLGNRLKKLESRNTSDQETDDAGDDGSTEAGNPVERLEQHLARSGDPETAKLFREALESLQPAASRNVERAPLTKAQAVDHYKDELAQVRLRYPQIKDVDSAADLLETANRMVRNGAIEPGTDIVDALQQAAQTIWPGGKQMSQRDLLERHREESDGQIDTGSDSRQPRPQAPSEDDEDRQAVRDLKRGKSPEEIQAARRRR